MPRGGRRIGAGRKPNPNKELERRGTVLLHPSVPSTNYPPAVVEEFDAPDALTADERKVWLNQAPFAFKNGTLTRASALSFERYCRIVVLEQNEAKSSGVGGANHRGLLKQINAYELQFLLTPAAKPMPVLDKPGQEPESKLAKFRR
jgi:hypothetical protein